MNARLILAVAAALLLHGRAQAGEGDFPRKVELKKFSTHYYVNVPSGYFAAENAKKRWPLLVGLHGAGDTAENFCNSFWRFAEEGYIVLAVKSPGHAWSGSEDDLVLAAIEEAVRDYRVHDGHISLAGFSSGSFFGMPLAFRRPEIFNALLAMGGGASVSPRAEALRLRVFLIVGDLDPVKGTIESAFKQLEKKKMDVTLRVMPDIGHVYPPAQEMEAVLKWFKAFSPDAAAFKHLEALMERARADLKKGALPKAIAGFQAVLASPGTYPGKTEAQKELDALAAEADREVERAHAMAEEGNSAGARSVLLAVWRKFKGLKEAEDAKTIADALE